MHRFTIFSVKTQALLLGCAGAWAIGACHSEAPPPAAADINDVGSARNCGEQGFVSAALFGSIDRELLWGADDFDCDNMLRPDGEGLRIRFTGEAANRVVAIILALPDLQRGQDGIELPTVVTLTVEGSGRFFSTADLDSCFTNIRAQRNNEESGAPYDAHGTMYCIEPLGEVNGDAAVSIPKLEFRTRIEWHSDDA